MPSDPTPHPDLPAEDGRLDLVATGAGFLRWLAIVIVVLVVAEIAARGVMNRSVDEIRWYDAAAQQRIGLLDDRGESVDVVFAGTSAAWQAFIPGEFAAATGQSSLNVGLAGAVPTVMGPWLTEEVGPRTSPEVVVWGLTPLDFAPAYGELQEEAYATAVETADGWLANLDRSVSSVSTLISSRRVLRSPSDLFGSGETQRAADLAEAAAVTGADGERTDFDVDVSPEGAAIQRSRLDGFEIDRRDVEATIEAIQTLQAAGTTVILVEVPVPDRFVDQLPQPERDLAATRAAIVEIGDSTSSDVILMSDTFGDTNFVDNIHLDADAAAQVTRWLAEILTTSGVDAPADGDDACGTVEVVDGVGYIIPVGLCRNATTG
jgi:hypothetical protein